MRKIKGFKLVLRPQEVKRRAKKIGIDLEQSGLADPVLNKTLDRLAKTLSPGVLFDTFGHPDEDQPLLSPIPGLAYSLILASLGGGFTPECRQKETVIHMKLWRTLEEIALDESIRFASSIIADEAEKDNCELSPMTPLAGSSALAAVVRKLDGVKLGVSCSDENLTPEASIAVSLSWLAKSKAKGRK